MHIGKHHRNQVTDGKERTKWACEERKVGKESRTGRVKWGGEHIVVCLAGVLAVWEGLVDLLSPPGRCVMASGACMCVSQWI
jgi:hypothetical protein